MNILVRLARKRRRRARLAIPARERRASHVFSRRHFMTVAALVLASCSAAMALAQAPSQSKSLHMVAVGVTNAKGQTPLKATAKDALDMARWARSQKDKLYGRVHVTPLTNEEA